MLNEIVIKVLPWYKTDGRHGFPISVKRCDGTAMAGSLTAEEIGMELERIMGDLRLLESTAKKGGD